MESETPPLPEHVLKAPLTRNPGFDDVFARWLAERAAEPEKLVLTQPEPATTERSEDPKKP